MSNDQSNAYLAWNLFRDFIRKKMMPLLGFPFSKIEKAKITFNSFTSKTRFGSREYLFSKKAQSVRLHFNQLLDFPLLNVHFPSPLSAEQQKLFMQVMSSFVDVYKDQIRPGQPGRYQEIMFDYAIERGILCWSANLSGKNANNLDALLRCLESWSQKTYEGHKVCFGILVNCDSSAKVIRNLSEEKVGSFAEFLSEEYSAVLTDGISSLIEVDQKGEFIAYHSITSDNVISACSLNDCCAPFRFAQAITRYVTGEKIGLFLLNSGDIILAKNRSVSFIKRNGSWLNFDRQTFILALPRHSISIDETLSKEIYASMIDISISHSGGIIAVVDDKKSKWLKDADYGGDKKQKAVISRLDLLPKPPLQITIDEQELNAMFDDLFSIETKHVKDPYLSKRIQRDVRKRMTKRYYLLSILKAYQTPKFQFMDRKLRSELSGLDGATIMDEDGNLLAVGAIIRNDAGSSGGGRGSAAKKLSKYGGFSIKISTDGYIELFVNGANVYSIK